MFRRAVRPVLRASPGAAGGVQVGGVAPGLRHQSAPAPNTVLKLVECPRDAMQGLRDFVPTKDKIRYINALLRVGFHTLDCGSFVSAPAVPQMADTAEVLASLDMSETKSKLLVVVCNQKGCKTACETPNVTYVGYPLSVSETFQQKNTNRNIATALNDLAQVQDMCVRNGKTLVTYISMGFGNPYGELYNEEVVAALVQKVAALDCRIISLADTVGVSQAPIIKSLYTSLIPRYPHVEWGAHFHSGVASTQEKIQAAVEAGCRRFDSAVGGMGGCPFAKSTLVGNVPTEGVVEVLEHLGFQPGLDRAALQHCMNIKHEVFGVAVKELALAATLHNEKAFAQLCLRHFVDHDSRGEWKLDETDFGRSLKAVLAELGEAPPSPEKIAQSFKKTDLSGNGYVTLDEYMFGARRLLKKRLDQNLMS